MFKKDLDAKLLEQGEGVTHGFSHYYEQEHGTGGLLGRIWTCLMDFGEGFYRREAPKDSRAMRVGAKISKFADQMATNMEENAKKEQNKNKVK